MDVSRSGRGSRMDGGNVDPLSREILTFWFETLDLSVEMEKRQVWFRATPEFDRHLVDHYTEDP